MIYWENKGIVFMLLTKVQRCILIFLVGLPILFMSVKSVAEYSDRMQASRDAIATSAQIAKLDEFAKSVQSGFVGDMDADLISLTRAITSSVTPAYRASTNPYRVLDEGFGSAYGIAYLYEVLLGKTGFAAVLDPVQYDGFGNTYPAIFIKRDGEYRVLLVVKGFASVWTVDDFTALLKDSGMRMLSDYATRLGIPEEYCAPYVSRTRIFGF